MPRRSHRPDRRATPARSVDPEERPIGLSGWQTRRSTRDGDFLVRTTPGAASGKGYRCPACQQVIVPGTPHLVVWPEWTPEGDDGVASRRHWHSSCWERRASRGGPGALSW